MTSPELRVFSFDPPDGEVGHIVMPATCISLGHRSWNGRKMMQFPPPFAHLTITEGEKLTHEKWADVRRAILELGGRIDPPQDLSR